MVCAQAIQNYPFTAEDCKHASKIFGKNILDILGKTVRKRAECVVPEYSDVPADLIKCNSWVTLKEDTMFVIQILFLVTSAHLIAEDDEFDEMNENSNDEIMDQTQRDELEDLEQIIGEEAAGVPKQPWKLGNNINEGRTRGGRNIWRP